tara:strand:- start:664 stop:828 length:165 start_codon:yes stop_codon:yes gene_type:complete
VKELFASAGAGLYGLLFFFIFFCAVAFWTFRPGKKKHYQDMGNIPLEEHDNERE